MNAHGEIAFAWPYSAPPKGNFNSMPGVTDQILTDTIYGQLLTIPGAMYWWDKGSYEYMLADPRSKLASDGRTYTYVIRRGLGWSDGKPITSDDVIATFRCLQLLENVVWQYVADVEKQDATTVVFRISKPSTLAQSYILQQKIQSAATFGAFTPRIESIVRSGASSTDTSWAKLLNELTRLRPKKVVVSGPFDFDYSSVSSQSLTLVRNRGGYAADTVHFDSVKVYTGDVTAVGATVLRKSIDFNTYAWPVPVEKEFVKAGLRILRPPTYFGPAVYFNLAKRPEFKDARVRQAFAVAIDREQTGVVALGKSGRGVRLMAGFSDLLVPKWLAAGDRAALDRYELDTGRAAKLLEEAGWKPSGDGWLRPDGSDAKYDMTLPAGNDDWVTGGDSAAAQLTNFGIKITKITVDAVQQSADLDAGKFELAIAGWGASTQWHPQFSFQQALFAHNGPGLASARKPGMAFPMEQTTKRFGRIDLHKVVVDSGLGIDPAQQRAQIRVAALAFNELLPIVPLFERFGNMPALQGRRVQKFPPDSDPVWRNSPYGDDPVTLLMLRGQLAPVRAQ